MQRLIWINSHYWVWMASHHQHSSTVDLSGFQVREYLVDIVQLRLMDFGSDLALGCKSYCFRQVLTAADDRAANGYAVEDDIEDGRPKLPRRKPDQADRTLAPHHLERLREGGGRHRGHQHAMGAAAGLFDDLLHSISRFGVDRHLGA